MAGIIIQVIPGLSRPYSARALPSPLRVSARLFNAAPLPPLPLSLKPPVNPHPRLFLRELDGQVVIARRARRTLSLRVEDHHVVAGSGWACAHSSGMSHRSFVSTQVCLAHRFSHSFTQCRTCISPEQPKMESRRRGVPCLFRLPHGSGPLTFGIHPGAALR